MLLDDISGADNVTLATKASEEALTSCELELGHPLPADLRSLLGESDGVVGEYGLDLVWPAARIAQDNKAFRSNADYRELYMSFDDLVFFGDAGNGDQFAVSLRGPNDVFVWNHEDDSRLWVASTPIQYLQRWLSGELEV